MKNHRHRIIDANVPVRGIEGANCYLRDRKLADTRTAIPGLTSHDGRFNRGALKTRAGHQRRPEGASAMGGAGKSIFMS